MLYSLPELDGAIDTVPLGGLVKDDIYLIPERVSRLLARVRRWAALARTPAPDRRIAVLLYGFPPGVGATGTAALLNVPASLERTLHALRAEVRSACCRGVRVIRRSGAPPVHRAACHPVWGRCGSVRRGLHMNDLLTEHCPSCPVEWWWSEWGWDDVAARYRVTIWGRTCRRI